MVVPPAVRTRPSVAPPSSAHVAPGVLVALVAWVGVAAVWLLFVMTRTGRLVDRLAIEGGYHVRNRFWDLAEQLLEVISVPFIGGVLLATMLLAVLRRRVATAVQVAVVMAGSNLTTQVLKRFVLDRPELGTGDSLLPSLPSGHTTAAASVAVALVIVVPRRLRAGAAIGGAVYAALTGISVLVAGWHRPSDAVAAVLVVAGWAGAAVVVRTVLDPSSRSLGDPAADRPRRTARAARGLLGAAAVTGLAAVIGLAATVGSLPVGADPRPERLTALAGGAAGVLAISCASFAVLLLLQRATESRLRART